MSRQEIDRNGYVFLSLFFLIGGLIGTAIFSSMFIMRVETMYSAFYWAFSMMLAGFGMGLSVSRAFKIIGYDK